MVKEARCMLILPLKRCRLYLKGKQYAGTEFHNVAIYGKKLLATYVPQHVLQIFTSQKDKLYTTMCMHMTYTK